MRSILVFVCVCALSASARAQEAIFLVRHAERADSSSDSPLSAEGRARAAKLADLLRVAGITQIYTTDLRRTIDTAMPFASASLLSPHQIPAADTGGVASRVLALRPSERVLVVGHSNTIPELLQRFGVKEPVTIGDDEYDNVFVVIRRGHASPILLRLKY